jgi:ATP-dependent RNA helicase RhlE
VSLADVQIFVLDEADRMLDMGFIHDIKRVLKMLPQQCQNLMFSATYSDDIRDLASRFVKNPVSLQVTPRNATADKVEQSAYRVPKDHKRHLLAHLITEGQTGTRCWCSRAPSTARTAHAAARARRHQRHGHPWQQEPERAHQGAAGLKENRITALVATEVAARASTSRSCRTS